MERFIKMKQDNLVYTEKQAIIYAVVKIRCMVWAPLRENSWGGFILFTHQDDSTTNIFLTKSDHSSTHAGLSAPVHTNIEHIYLHPVTLIWLTATQYYPLVTDIPWGLDQTLPYFHYHKPIALGKHLQAAFLAHSTALSKPEKMPSKLVEYKQGLRIPTEFLVWPQEARKWIQNERPQCSVSWAQKKGTNSILLWKDTWSCAFTAPCWQRAKVLAWVTAK